MKKNCKYILLGLAFAATLLCGTFVAAQAPATVLADDPATARVFYYADLGNLATSVQGTTPTSGRASEGWGGQITNGFMTENELTFGTGEDGVYTGGLYNSVTDWTFYKENRDVDGGSRDYLSTELKPDPVTGKNWGAYWEGEYGWCYWRYGKTTSGAPGYNTSRYVNESRLEGQGLFYKFEVDDASPLRVIIGTRKVQGPQSDGKDPGLGDGNNGNVKINGGDKLDIPNIANTDKFYDFDKIDTAKSTDICGVLDTTDNKHYVTLQFGSDGKLTYVSWILIASVDYELPISYTFSQAVKKGDTTIPATPSDGSAVVAATISEESRAAIDSTDNFGKTEIKVNIGSKELTTTVTVVSKYTEYFVNLGDSATNGVLLGDGPYSSDTHYGYIEEDNKPHSGKTYPGYARLDNGSFDISSRLDMDRITYKFDNLAPGSYGVTVGVSEFWSEFNRKHIVSANGGEQVVIMAPNSNNGTNRGTCYGEVGSDGVLKVKLGVDYKEAGVFTYILVFEANKITYDSNGGSAVAAQYFEKGATATLKAQNPTRADYEFDGWFTAAEGGDAVTTASVNTTVYAHWTACEYDNSTVTWTWTGTSAAEAHLPCKHDGCNQYRTVNGTVTSEVTKAATCTEKGSETFTATVTINGVPFTNEKTAEIDALGHSYTEPTENKWTWNNETHAATVTIDCSRNCGHSENREATVTSTQTDATCTSGGTVTFTATVTVDGEQYSNQKSENGTPLGHSYGAPASGDWTWNEHTATVELTCTRSGCTGEGHTKSETAQMSESTTATCTAAGTKMYTAAVTVNGVRYTDEKTEAEDALGHHGVHKEAVAATCTEHGKAEHYECDRCHNTFADAACEQAVSEETINAVAALGHSYDTEHLVWNWTGYTQASVHTACTRCNHDGDIAATVTSEVTKEATETEDGERIYTATATLNGTTVTDTKKETIFKTGKAPEPGAAYEPLEENGCGSSVTGGYAAVGWIAMLVAFALVATRRKSKEE